MNGLGAMRRRAQGGKIWDVQREAATFDTHLENCFMLGRLVPSYMRGFCLCRQQNKLLEPQIQNSLMPAHNWWTGKNTPILLRNHTCHYPKDFNCNMSLIFKNQSSSLLWVACPHPAVTSSRVMNLEYPPEYPPVWQRITAEKLSWIFLEHFQRCNKSLCHDVDIPAHPSLIS